MSVEYLYQCDACLKRVPGDRNFPKGWGYILVDTTKLLACPECIDKTLVFFGKKKVKK